MYINPYWIIPIVARKAVFFADRSLRRKKGTNKTKEISIRQQEMKLGSKPLRCVLISPKEKAQTKDTTMR
jgi:hypothetical protein